MASSFFGINIGQQGLYTAQTNLNVTSHNISNADTDGYSRQYTVQSATRPMGIAGKRGMLGTGSEVTNVLQHRDSYLDDKYWDMTNELGEYEIKDELLSQMEVIFNEPSDYGYSEYFNDVFDALQKLSTNPGDPTFLNAFTGSLENFTTYLNDVGNQLSTVQEDANYGIGNSVDQINYFAQQIATLNHQIANLELTGNVANDLRDSRNLLVDELSKVVNVDTREITDVNGKQTFRITINGQILVDDTNANYLNVVPRETLSNPEDGPDMYDVFWESGKELYLDNDSLSGELKGYIDIRDGNNDENFEGEITAVAADLTVTVDNLSRTDLPGEGELNVNGTLMRYSSYTIVGNTIEFEFGIPGSVVGLDAVGTDVYGDEFTGTILSNTATQVVIANPLDQDLDPNGGTINLGGTTITYTGYSKAGGTGDLTLDIAIPPAAVGTTTKLGDDMDFKGVPYYLDQMNDFVRTIAMEFNALNESGNGGTGVPIFTYEGYTGVPPLDTAVMSSYDTMTIHNIIINPAVVDDPRLIENSVDPNAGESANDLMLDMIRLRGDVEMFDKGKPDNFVESLIGELGIDTKMNESLMKGQEDLTHLVENQRLSVSGVDMNEETTNLVRYQQAYNQSAHIISIMNQIYDTTINRMGL